MHPGTTLQRLIQNIRVCLKLIHSVWILFAIVIFWSMNCVCSSSNPVILVSSEQCSDRKGTQNVVPSAQSANQV